MQDKKSLSQAQPSIMVVDDDAAILKLLAVTLRSQGYEVTTVQDSREALAQYQATRPDLILLDLNMPHHDGFAVLAQLAAQGEPLLPPVIFLTAQDSRDYLLRALREGATDFITKPFDHIELIMRVRNLLKVHLAHQFMHDEKATLEQLVQERTRELHDTRLEVVRRLGRAAEYRDNETGLHIVRMSEYAALLARGLGWDEAQCDLMLNASPMHDIGKIGIPDAILLKPARFEPHEWEVMKTHTTIGAKILEGEGSALMEMARSIALTHHERWDGSGYPRGFQGEDIPQAGRITAVADVFDALTSSRPYKQAWTVEEAIAFVHDHSGTHFDPAVVACFMDSLPQVHAIRERGKEPAAV